MPRLQFGAFLAPHHPIAENPTLQFRGDLDFVEHLDKLGFDEFWCGEHHSTGWEMIASPEMFLAAAGERTHRIKLGTGVVSLPYHHPFIVAQRIVQLDHMTGGRAIFGSGPGALPSDAHTLGIDPMVQRDRQDEAIGVIRRLLRGEERFSYESDWFTLRDARLHLLPLQEDLPFAVASIISPSGMTLAGKHGTGVLSIGTMSTEGLQALPLQWSFAEESAAKHGNAVDRRDWRIVMTWHVAETREQARREAREGCLQRSGRGSGQGGVRGRCGNGNRHARRPGELHPAHDGTDRRLRHRYRLRARLGEPGKHPAQLGHGGALRHTASQWHSGGISGVAPVRGGTPRVVPARQPGGAVQNHGKRARCCRGGEKRQRPLCHSGAPRPGHGEDAVVDGLTRLPIRLGGGDACVAPTTPGSGIKTLRG